MHIELSTTRFAALLAAGKASRGRASALTSTVFQWYSGVTTEYNFLVLRHRCQSTGEMPKRSK